MTDLNIDPLLRDIECAKMLGIAKPTFWAWLRKGTVPRPLKIGGTSRWKQSDIQAIIDQAEADRNDAA